MLHPKRCRRCKAIWDECQEDYRLKLESITTWMTSEAQVVFGDHYWLINTLSQLVALMVNISSVLLRCRRCKAIYDECQEDVWLELESCTTWMTSEARVVFGDQRSSATIIPHFSSSSVNTSHSSHQLPIYGSLIDSDSSSSTSSSHYNTK